LKDIYGQQYQGDLCGRVCSHTTAHGWSSWTQKCIFGVYGPKWHKLQVYEPKKCIFKFYGPIFSKFIDLNDTNYKLMIHPYKLVDLWCILRLILLTCTTTQFTNLNWCNVSYWLLYNFLSTESNQHHRFTTFRHFLGSSQRSWIFLALRSV
jgi:hypothetical protein